MLLLRSIATRGRVSMSLMVLLGEEFRAERVKQCTANLIATLTELDGDDGLFSFIHRDRDWR